MAKKLKKCFREFQINTIYSQINLPYNLDYISINKKKLTNLNEFKNLNLQNINFKYQDSSKYIFNNVSLKINRGEYIGIVGETGSGKSTLADLIIGLLEPIKGSVKVNDLDIKEYSNWETKIGYVPQFIYLTDDTLKNNIALGLENKEINKTKVLDSIKEADLTIFLENLEKGIEEVMGERGVKISGGEMQRIGLARAVYNNPDLLIFDEFTSSLDLKTEEGILDNIKRYKGKKTIIIISHKLSTLKDCDKIIEVKNGEIQEKR